MDNFKPFMKDFGDKRLAEITPLLLEKWRTKRLESGTHPATVNRNITALKAALVKAAETDSTKLVFPNKDGKQFNEIKKSWATILKIAQIEDFRWHDLRHHFASRLAMAGVDLNTIRELLGHADIKMTLRYAHAPEHKAEAVAKLINY